MKVKKLPRVVKLDIPTEQEKSNLHTKQKKVFEKKKSGEQIPLNWSKER